MDFPKSRSSNMLQGIDFRYQKIMKINRAVVGYEIFSRLPCDSKNVRLEDFFGGLSAVDNLSITVRQIEIATQIYEAYGVVCSVNVDNSILHFDSLRMRLIEACEVQPCPVVLEFTEISPLPPSDEVNSVFLELKKAGARLALDDFGAGFNGISAFANYDFEIVKLDRSLIQGMQVRSQNLKVLEHVLAMLNSLNKSHVVEGVEHEDQLKRLVDIGYTVFQGFFFHQPAPVGEVLW